MNKMQWSTTDYLHEYPQHSYFSESKLDPSSLVCSVSDVYSTRSPSGSPLSHPGYGSDGLSPLAANSPDSLMSGFAAAPMYPVGSNSLNDTIAKASALPESFYPEFLQYSKESFESKKRARPEEQTRVSRKKTEETDAGQVNEIRRQIHIQSEQKRRAQIKDGFEDLRAELPACLNKKMSKVTLLHRTVQHIQHLKNTQITILTELERLVQENEQLRSFQQSVLQKQALENIYSI